jgi:peptidoglycan/LPS O-acetylase OafA/YrhL
MMLLRVFPIVALLGAAALAAVDSSGNALAVAGHTLVALGCASFLLSLVLNAPEAERMKSPRLRFFGDNSYAIYLVHLPVLWAMHGVILGAQPGLLTPLQCAVTLASLPVTVAIGWLLTAWVEVPITNFGRSFTWGPPKPVAVAKAEPEVVGIPLAERMPAVRTGFILLIAAVALFVFTFFRVST